MDSDEQKNDQEDNWAALTDSLGLESQPEVEAEQPEQAATESEPEPVVEHTIPSRPPSAWDELADERVSLEVSGIRSNKTLEEPSVPTQAAKKVEGQIVVRLGA